MEVRRPSRYENGKKSEAKKFYAFFADHNRVQRKLALFNDRKASDEGGRKIARLVDLRAANDTLPEELSRWVETTTPCIRSKLALFGIIAPAKMAAGKPLAEHIADYEPFLRARKRDAKHIRGTKGQLLRIANDCRFVYWSDVSASRLDAFLNDLGDGEDGASDRTINGYLIAFKSFCNWMVKDRRASESPVRH